MTDKIEWYHYAPVDHWLIWLAQGWEFTKMDPHPIRGHHGAWSVLLRRKE